MDTKEQEETEDWEKLRALVLNKMASVLMEYDNMQRNIAQEQKVVMDRMKEVYLQARSVTRAMDGEVSTVLLAG